MPRALLVDVFTTTPFSGNTAGVVLLDTRTPDPEWMQRTAAELNQPETAFVFPPDALGRRKIVYFTPFAPVRYCGHATIAAAHVLGFSITFVLLDGSEVRCAVEGNSIKLTAPIDTLTDDGIDDNTLADVAAAFGLDLADIIELKRGEEDLLVNLDTPENLRRAKAVPELVKPLSQRGVILTTLASSDPSIVVACRCFYPNLGLNPHLDGEDIGTGSAGRSLGTYWRTATAADLILVEQWSPKPSHYSLSHLGEAIELTTRAVTTFDGALAA